MMRLSEFSLLYYSDGVKPAQALAMALGVSAKKVEVHHFPDQESLVTVPDSLPEHVVIYRSLNQPNPKLVELLLAADAVKRHGAKRVSLVAPYLCYMRQDQENKPGEAISQQVIGQLLTNYFDDLITVDAHLHRISRLDEAFPMENAINLLATQPIVQFIQANLNPDVLFGPDNESEQWVKQVAQQTQLPYAVANKTRMGDNHVKIDLAENHFNDKNVLILDDMASTGRTLGLAAKKLYEAGAREVNAIVTHALFVNDAKAYLHQCGVANIWSTTSIQDSSNAIVLDDLLSETVKSIL